MHLRWLGKLKTAESGHETVAWLDQLQSEAVVFNYTRNSRNWLSIECKNVNCPSETTMSPLISLVATTVVMLEMGLI